MIRCRTCATSYNETFTQCPVCGTRNPIYTSLKKSVFIIDKLSFKGKNLEQVEKMPASEVSTVVSFHIPFLLHLVDGSYEMRDDSRWIAFQLARKYETPEFTRRFFGIELQVPKNAEIPKD